MKALYSLVILLFLAGCSSNQSEKSVAQPTEWMGEWNATWVTDSTSFPKTEDITSFTMPGKITFSAEQVNIKAYGYEGCVFSKDTLDHSLHWKVSNDSLILINDEETPGMIYQIKASGSQEIKLQLMDDIFLTLTK